MARPEVEPECDRLRRGLVLCLTVGVTAGVVVFARFGIFSVPVSLNFQAAITSAVTVPIAASAISTPRFSSRRCWRRTFDVRRATTGSRGSSSPVAKRELYSST